MHAGAGFLVAAVSNKKLKWENVTQRASGSKLDLYSKDEDAILIADKIDKDFSAFGYDS
jgi:hypothetical protein